MEDIIRKVISQYLSEGALKWTEDALRDEAKKYQFAKDFRDANFSAYNVALKKGKDFFNDITSHMKRLKRGKYSDEELIDIAKKYNTKTDFLTNNAGAWDAAYKKGKDFYNQITSHMIDGHTKPRKYDDETLKNLISKYTTLRDFREENPQAYDAIRRKNKIEQDEFYKNLITQRVDSYTEQDLINIASKYTTLKDFWKKDRRAVITAKKIGEDFFNNLTAHMLRQRRDGVTDEELINIAKQYNDLTDFYTNDSATYNLLKNRGLMTQATAHMNRDVTKWTKDDLISLSKNYSTLRDFRKENENLYAWALNNVSEKERKDIFSHFKPLGNLRKRLIYAFEFPDKSVYVGLTFDADGRYKQHQKSVTSAVNKYIQQTGLEPEFKKLTEYVSDEQAVRMEYDYVNDYRDNGWKILNIAKTGGLGSIPIKWTIDILKQEALKYNTRAQFQKENPKAYGAALRYRIMDDITQHMGKRKNEKVTDDYILNIAKKYNTLKDFRFNEPNVYQLILRRNLIDDATSHMIRQYNKLTNDELKNIAKKYNTKTEFYQKDMLAYTQAARRGILDDITSHFIKSRQTWDLDKIKDVANQYDSVSEFKKTAAYQAAHRMGVLPEVTSHMRRGKVFGKNK
jgi:predicted GIY-YIG superfamily endonuclease